ncbi:MAG: hypothetical protein R2873_06830 [Caldilineaceae bacterium]
MRAGETILYQITVENRPVRRSRRAHRRRSARGDNLRQRSAQCRDNVLEILCDLGDVAAGERVSVFLELRDDMLADGSSIFNTATVSSPTDPSEASATAVTTVEQTPLAVADLRLSKQADADTVIAGGTIRYRSR